MISLLKINLCFRRGKRSENSPKKDILGSLGGFMISHMSPDERLWAVWIMASAVSFAALETRALRREDHVTLSALARQRARRNRTTKAATTIAMSGIALWWINHVIFVEVEIK